MPSLRQVYRVAWDDREPVEVRTTVTDVINAVDARKSDAKVNKVSVETSLLYAALLRAGHDVPPYEEWLDLLDMYEEVRATEPPEDPTPTAPLDTVQSLSVSLPARTGGVGLTKTPVP